MKGKICREQTANGTKLEEFQMVDEKEQIINAIGGERRLKSVRRL
jgi:hypothetical protein